MRNSSEEKWLAEAAVTMVGLFFPCCDAAWRTGNAAFR
jgi:hypothetical protein